MEVVSADEDDAELRGWAYLYDNSTLEKLASSKIRAEGGRGSTFNPRLEKSLHKAAKNLISVITAKQVIVKSTKRERPQLSQGQRVQEFA